MDGRCYRIVGLAAWSSGLCPLIIGDNCLAQGFGALVRATNEVSSGYTGTVHSWYILL